MRSRNLFITLLILTVAMCGAGIYFLINSHRTVPYIGTIPHNEQFSTSTLIQSDITEQALPTIYNMPPEIGWSQLSKLRMFLYQFGEINSMTSRPDGYYRQGSVSVASATGEVGVLLDIPSATQTLSIKVLSNNTLDITCASIADQKEVSWKCSNEALGESE